MKNNLTLLATLLLAPLAALHAANFHVATTGNDSNPGTQAAPLRTIQCAANVAQPGDTMTVHAGTYRERVNPPRGGESDVKRIVYLSRTRSEGRDQGVGSCCWLANGDERPRSRPAPQRTRILR